MVLLREIGLVRRWLWRLMGGVGIAKDGMVKEVMECEFLSWSQPGCEVGGAAGRGRTATKGEGEGKIGCAEDGRGGRLRRLKCLVIWVGMDWEEPWDVCGDAYVEVDAVV